MKIRLLAVVPVLALGCLGLTACDSKTGTAAVVDGHKISEATLSSYLPANAKPIVTNSGASSTPAKAFVLRLLVQDEVFPLLLKAGGVTVTDAQLDASKATVLQGGSEADLTTQITKAGLKPKFEGAYLRYLELAAVVQKSLTTAKAQQTALAAVKDAVSINPRYGSWDPASLTLTDLGKSELPPGLSYSGTLPGDVQATTAQ